MHVHDQNVGFEIRHFQKLNYKSCTFDFDEI